MGATQIVCTWKGVNKLSIRIHLSICLTNSYWIWLSTPCFERHFMSCMCAAYDGFDFWPEILFIQDSAKAFDRHFGVCSRVCLFGLADVAASILEGSLESSFQSSQTCISWDSVLCFVHESGPRMGFGDAKDCGLVADSYEDNTLGGRSRSESLNSAVAQNRVFEVLETHRKPAFDL